VFKNLFFLTFSFVAIYGFASDDNLEVLCSKALLSEMQKQKLISNSTGVCVQSLTDLPQVSIGLGSSVYTSGAASGKSIGNEDEKIKLITGILTGKPLGNNFAVYGYADGENNTIPSYTDQFLGTKKTFKKSDIRSLIKDQATSSKILSLLEDVDDKAELQPVKSDGPGQSFKREAGLTYHPKIERVMSLINNYYLSVDRAVQTCMQLVEGEYATPELAKSNCAKKVTGHASPNSEVLSQGKNTCDARRKAVLVLNPGVKATKGTEPSKVQPNFQIPSEGESRRDMQVAATLDLLKKIKTGSSSGTDANSVIEKLAGDCSGTPLDSSAYKFNKDNLKRMYDDIQKNLAGIVDPKIKTAVTNGDYLKVKGFLEKSEDDLADGLVTAEDPTQKLMSVLNYGADKKEAVNRITFYYPVAKGNVSLSCTLMKDADRKKFDFNGTSVDVYECWDVENKKKSNYQNLVFDPRNKTKAHNLVNDSRGNFRKNVSPLKDITYGDASYPNASRDFSSTDVFNCLSASAAVEEKLNNQNQTGAGGELIDPYDMYPDASGNVKVSINPKDIPSHEKKGKEEPIVKGWVCEACHSGLQVNQDAKKEWSSTKKSRDFTMIDGGTHSQSAAPVSSLGLTFGSMKNLGFRKVTRESFNGKCAAPKKVCDCLKNSSQYGGLDKILSASTVVNLNKNLKADMAMSENDLKNSCLYTPPVAPSCSVAPSGKGSEKVSRGLSTPSCMALTRFMEKYPDRKAVVDKTYPKIEDFITSHQKVKLGSMLCKNAFPSDDDSKDCPSGGSPSKSSGGSSKGVQR
jgi:hypothetical protein